jgi:phage shock protein A
MMVKNISFIRVYGYTLNCIYLEGKMGFFSRLINLISGLFGGFVASVEEQNPAAVYEQAIQQRKKQYQDLKKASAQIIFLRDKTQSELDAKRTELEQVEIELDYAVENNEDEAAMELLSLQDELTARVETLTAEMQGISTQAEQAMASMQGFQSEIKKLQREKSQMLAEKASAEAQIAIQEQLSGLSVEADMQALDNVRESIHRKKAEAKLNAELNENSADSQLKRIRAKVGAGRNAARLAELKRQRAEKTAGASQSTASESGQSDVAARLAAIKAKRESNKL